MTQGYHTNLRIRFGPGPLTIAMTTVRYGEGAIVSGPAMDSFTGGRPT